MPELNEIVAQAINGSYNDQEEIEAIESVVHPTPADVVGNDLFWGEPD